METSRDCPFCDAKAKLESVETTKEFKKETFKIREFYYKCTSCGEEFMTTATDELNINQVYNQYREKHGIPFPEEMVQIRTRYGLSAQKMSQILGLGINTYSNYEKGEIPSLAGSRLIYSAGNPEIFHSYLAQAMEFLSGSTYNSLEKRLKEFQNDTMEDSFTCNFNWYKSPNKFTGYSLPNREKVLNLLIYIVSKCNPDFNDKLKINKMLFYSDFINYKHTGKSITGLAYRAIPFGPVPANYDFIFAYFSEKERIIEPEFVQSQNSRVIECFKALRDFDSSLFNDEEMNSINEVITHFKDISSWDLVDLSHKEKAWTELKDTYEIIDYQYYAFDTIGIPE